LIWRRRHSARWRRVSRWRSHSDLLEVLYRGRRDLRRGWKRTWRLEDCLDMRMRMGAEDHWMVSSSLSALGPWDVGKETGAHDKCSGGYSFRIVGQWDSWYGIAWIGCEEGSSTSSRLVESRDYSSRYQHDVRPRVRCHPVPRRTRRDGTGGWLRQASGGPINAYLQRFNFRPDGFALFEFPTLPTAGKYVR